MDRDTLRSLPIEWFAGYVDGRSFWGFGGGVRGLVPHIRVRITNRALQREFVRRFGGKLRRPNNVVAEKTCWYLYGQATLDFVEQIRPYLVQCAELPPLFDQHDRWPGKSEMKQDLRRRLAQLNKAR